MNIYEEKIIEKQRSYKYIFTTKETKLNKNNNDFFFFLVGISYIVYIVHENGQKCRTSFT